ncbi:hypothetical protein [Natrinema sp. SYSU A 869]|uniref:DUF7344 domain-containing protein n=1 Tax=Natrinema sp. SYSU A 869 TaxID=2871694 RepID=UPI001CA3DA4F|nr:hypothetical protein [Natrinema sp. SYSU A 869]
MNTGTSLTEDEVYTLLSSCRRRYALHACLQTESTITLSDLAEQVAAWEYEKSLEAVSSEERRRVYTSLQQTHLPKMDRWGVVEFERGVIEPTEQASEIGVYMDVVPANSIPWAHYYLGVAAIAAAVTGGVWLGIYPETIPDLLWATLISGVFLLSAAAHVWQTTRTELGRDGPHPEL